MDPKIDVPQPVREFAQNSVDQAEKALASFMEAAGKSAAMVPTPMADVAKQALSIAEANLRASLEHARKLLQAKAQRSNLSKWPTLALLRPAMLQTKHQRDFVSGCVARMPLA